MDRTRYKDQLNRAGEWLLTLNDEQAIFGNGCDVKVALYVCNVSQFRGGGCPVSSEHRHAVDRGTRFER